MGRVGSHKCLYLCLKVKLNAVALTISAARTGPRTRRRRSACWECAYETPRGAVRTSWVGAPGPRAVASPRSPLPAPWPHLKPRAPGPQPPRHGLTPTPPGIPRSRPRATRPTCCHHHERVGRKGALRPPAALRRAGQGGASASASGSRRARESAQSLVEPPAGALPFPAGAGGGGPWGLGRRVGGRGWGALRCRRAEVSPPLAAGDPASARAARGANGRPGGVHRLPERRPGPGNGPRGNRRVRTLLRCRG